MSDAGIRVGAGEPRRCRSLARARLPEHVANVTVADAWRWQPERPRTVIGSHGSRSDRPPVQALPRPSQEDLDDTRDGDGSEADDHQGDIARDEQPEYRDQHTQAGQGRHGERGGHGSPIAALAVLTGRHRPDRSSRPRADRVAFRPVE